MRLNDVSPKEWDDMKLQDGHSKEMVVDAVRFDGIAKEDVVNKPKHYNNGNVEAIEAIKASMSSTEFKGYLKGNVLKYLWRYSYKNKPVEDLQKCKWYLEKLLQENTLNESY